MDSFVIVAMKLLEHFLAWSPRNAMACDELFFFGKCDELSYVLERLGIHAEKCKWLDDRLIRTRVA
jgi:hypothetical protein